ncbi:MAG: recombinase family protein [Lachnospiraceae bacterium]
MAYCMYLRKSRKDEEIESARDEDTLARHESTLLATAKRQNIIISNIYREVVSGETIEARPVMRQLLREVEGNMWDGVLVMEVERLARGDTIDQGIVQRAFQYTDTLIITPTKTYDPANEFDQEYFEFGLFMSRREYKTTKRRMQAGRYAAAKEGKWPFNTTPYGFQRKKMSGEKGWVLEVDEAEAPVVQLIFSLFTGANRMGLTKIVHYLNERGIKPRKADRWVESTIREILKNKVYDKKVAIGQRKTVTKIIEGSPVKTRPRSDDYSCSDGLHPRMIDHDVFEEAQAYLSATSFKLPESYKVQNPLAGILVCEQCRRKMLRRPASKDLNLKNRQKYDMIICKTPGCTTVGSPLDVIERELILTLKDWVSKYELDYEVPKSNVDKIQQLLNTATTEYDLLLKQNDKLHDLLEQGVYDTETFLSRSKNLEERIKTSEAGVDRLKLDLSYEREKQAHMTEFLPNCKQLLDCYWELDAQDRNKGLKILLESVEYKKTERNKKGDKDNPSFELTLKPRIPRE